jgi:hypothetical protein
VNQWIDISEPERHQQNSSSVVEQVIELWDKRELNLLDRAIGNSIRFLKLSPGTRQTALPFVRQKIALGVSRTGVGRRRVGA